MKQVIVFSILLASTGLHAADLSAFAEGKPESRERLAGIEGAPAIEIDLKDWKNSAPLKLASLKGKIVLLDFWATWCGPCLASIPHNNELAAKYAKDLIIIGVCNPKGAEKLQKTVDDKKITYPVAVDEEGKATNAYKVNGYPDYYLIDREGKVVLADCSNGKVTQAIEALLNDKPAANPQPPAANPQPPTANPQP